MRGEIDLAALRERMRLLGGMPEADRYGDLTALPGL
jgi:hypothetical protein